MSLEIKCMYPRRVNSDMVQCLPLVKYSGVIELVETEESLDRAMSEIAKEKILGFDTETRPNFNKGRQHPVSILQLGGENKVWVIRLEPLASRLSEIFSVLENPSVKKSGIAVQGDIKALKVLSPFNPAGFVDVAHSTTKIGVINTGMRNLAALFFGERLSKAAQLTNWASETLTSKQLEYAATDAWMSRRLFLAVRSALDDNRIAIEPEPEPASEHFSVREFIKKMVRRGLKKLLGKKSEAKDGKRPRGYGRPRGGRGRGGRPQNSGRPKKR